MNQKLITLNGKSREKIPPGMARLPDISKLSDFDAGLVFFKIMADNNPGLKLGHFLQPEKLSGFFSSISRAISKTTEGIGDVLKNTGNWVGEKSGEAIRLFSDKEVQEGVTRAATAYASGGQSEALRVALANFGGSKNNNVVSTAGQGFKENYAAMNMGSINPMYLAAGMGGLILIVLLTQRK